MDATATLKRTVLTLAAVGLLAGCGDNTDVGRGETNCDSQPTTADNAHDASCKETGSNG
ncbi:hypothetical protein [Goekera deserti]|uniref:Uncharacterized protein n=1 Tax=Goekera deserti TaxID=2497753 RepID=A0A7K3WFD6_9ACTN|nr:hypothetical protein [Goekera deserti]NDI48509.1 hypothetical protein [Goekera deserti]NEL55112.1 hypothetical protein [Goekera deserti]